MSDILLYNAISENQRLIKTYIQKTVDPGSPFDTSTYCCNFALGSMYNSFNRLEGVTQCPGMVKHWKKYLTPLTAPRANGFKVCDTSGYYRCGSSCIWAVPAGVTQVQFQLWGHGGGNSGQCCCGGTPFGPTGSYAMATVPVTAGEVFCLVSGCAYCCYATQTTPGYSATPTCVMSFTNANFFLCASGATPALSYWYNSIPGNAISQCGPPTNDCCNPSSCSGWNFCWDTAADNVCVPHAFSKCESWYLGCNCRANSCVYGLPVIYPAIVIDSLGIVTNSIGCHISAPVFGFENCTCLWATSTVGSPGSEANGLGVCYYQASAGYQQIPAVGGFGGWVCGGDGAVGGDAGGMGMICVSWNC